MYREQILIYLGGMKFMLYIAPKSPANIIRGDINKVRLRTQETPLIPVNPRRI